MRFTVTDKHGTTSFIGPCHAIKMLVAGCARGATTLRELLDYTRRYDEDFVVSVINGLSSFDEHNVETDTSEIERQISEKPADELPPFRVYNEATRAVSSQPTRSGLIIFNLAARRIVQVQNNYEEIRRKGRGRIRRSGEPVRLLYHYELPGEWALVP